MSIKIKVIAICLFSFLNFSCNTTEPPPVQSNGKINLTIEDVSCTEAWIKVTAENQQLPIEINILSTDPDGNSKSHISILTTPDSTLYIDSLLPNKAYKFSSKNFQASSNPASSIKLTTMDTTSHNFTFETFTFGGEAGSSSFYDVAIVNENCIYAVGEIYLKDSLGNPDPQAYNLARWDGNKWELKKIPFNYQGTDFYGPIYSVFAFNENDIWLGIGSIIHFDGNVFKSITIPISIFPSRINKIWGSSSEDLYIVGNNGSIAHYQNGIWQEIKSGTNLNINDIYGAFNKKTNEYEILAVASNVLESLDKEIIKINKNGTTKLLSKEGINSTLSGIWFKPHIKYYAVGAGIHFKEMLNNPKWESYLPGEVSSYYSYGIKANGLNDIAVAGGVGEVLHFNGDTWKSYFNETNINGNYLSLDIKNNIIVVAGQDAPKAAITIGRR